MWFGTFSGLNRYDGYNFKIFRHDEMDTTSISDNFINNCFEGPGDKIWIKTQSAYNIYDPVTEKIDRKADRFLQSLGLPSEGLVTILRSKKNFYFVYAQAGIYALDEKGKITPVTDAIANKQVHSPITSASLDSKNYIWILRHNGIIEKFDGEQQKNLLHTTIFQKQNLQLQFGYLMFIDNQDELWLYQRNTLSGLYRYNPSRNSVLYYSQQSASPSLSNNAINGITQDNKGLIWIATDHGGVNILDKESHTITHVENSETDNKSIADNVLNAIYKDNQGIIWLGTNKKGINIYDENSNRFPLYHHAGK